MGGAQGPLSHFPEGIADGPLTVYTGLTDALAFPGIAVIASTDVDAATLTPPIAGPGSETAAPIINSTGILGQDGVRLEIISDSAHAHTVKNASDIFYDGSGTAYNTLTFAAQIGANCVLRAYNGIWVILSMENVTPSHA